MNTKRMKTLIDHFKKIKPEQIDLHTWKGPISYPVNPECKTVYCIVGWGTTSPKLQAQGLVFDYGHITYKSYTNWEAVQQFFNINQATAQHLFTAHAYPFTADKAYIIAKLEMELTAAIKEQTKN